MLFVRFRALLCMVLGDHLKRNSCLLGLRYVSLCQDLTVNSGFSISILSGWGLVMFAPVPGRFLLFGGGNLFLIAPFPLPTCTFSYVI